jgi:hypothetical protein
MSAIVWHVRGTLLAITLLAVMFLAEALFLTLVEPDGVLDVIQAWG